MNRGDIIIAGAGSGFGSKPRPALVIQSDRFAAIGTLLIALFTSELDPSPLVRPCFEPDDINGLVKSSALMVNVIVTIRADQIDKVIGRLSETDMARADSALMIFMGFTE